MSITDLVKGTTARFVSYREGNFIYEVVGKDFQFPVPLNDLGNATLLAEDKALLFMRYIRKQLDILKAYDPSPGKPIITSAGAYYAHFAAP